MQARGVGGRSELARPKGIHFRQDRDPFPASFMSSLMLTKADDGEGSKAPVSTGSKLIVGARACGRSHHVARSTPCCPAAARVRKRQNFAWVVLVDHDDKRRASRTLLSAKSSSVSILPRSRAQANRRGQQPSIAAGPWWVILAHWRQS
jgi:hypothetical protein